MRTTEDIIALYHERKRNQHASIQRMRRMRDMYNGDIVVPLPELDANELPAVANLAQQGIDQVGRAVSDVIPDITYPSLRPGIKRHDEAARMRRTVNFGWWEHNHIDLILGRRARWLLAYATSPVYLRWNNRNDALYGRKRRQMPVWQAKDPLSTFPAPCVNPDDTTPPDVIFLSRMKVGTLRSQYAAKIRDLHIKPDENPDLQYDILEYCDAEQSRMIVLGPNRNPEHSEPISSRGVTLEWYPNRTEMCLAVIPGRITLEKGLGQFDGMIGSYLTQAMLTALEIHAVKRGVFAETWLIGREGRQPKVIREADGPRGHIGIVQDGEIRDLAVNPGFMTNPTIDRLERAQRLQGGVPAELGGEAASNIRTGRRGSQLISAAVDPVVREAQKVLAVSLRAEDERAIALDKAYGASASKRFAVSWKGAKGWAEYTPQDLWEDDTHNVNYAFAGSDTANLVIEGAQRVGADLMSHRRFMELDPMIDDPESEEDRIIAERMMRAWLSSVEAAAADPAGPYTPTQIARLMELIVSNKKSPPEAVAILQEEVQQQQAEQTAMEPEAMPGLDGAPPAIPEVSPSQGNLRQLLGSLNATEMAMR